MHAVVSGPVPDASLVGDRVDEHEEDAEGEGGLVGAVGPETVRPGSDAQTRDGPQEERPEKCIFVAARNGVKAHQSGKVYEGDVDAHGPVHVAGFIVANRRSNCFHFSEML